MKVHSLLLPLPVLPQIPIFSLGPISKLTSRRTGSSWGAYRQVRFDTTTLPSRVGQYAGGSIPALPFSSSTSRSRSDCKPHSESGKLHSHSPTRSTLFIVISAEAYIRTIQRTKSVNDTALSAQETPEVAWTYEHKSWSDR
jgi:hypothetical protein